MFGWCSRGSKIWLKSLDAVAGFTGVTAECLVSSLASALVHVGAAIVLADFESVYSYVQLLALQVATTAMLAIGLTDEMICPVLVFCFYTCAVIAIWIFILVSVLGSKGNDDPYYYFADIIEAAKTDTSFAVAFMVVWIAFSSCLVVYLAHSIVRMAKQPRQEQPEAESHHRRSGVKFQKCQ